jgi:phosphoribosyl-AMP cyclohydrolase / phosphoribosyl-ATP pyrophosphohydrolase
VKPHSSPARAAAAGETARPRATGNAGHLNRISCFGEADASGLGRLARLEATIAERAAADPSKSWTARLLAEGVKRVAQKVGEEGVETALAGVMGPGTELAAEEASGPSSAGAAGRA